MKTIAQELGVKEFPFDIRDGRGNLIYREWEHGLCERWEYNSEGFEIYYETSESFWGKWERDLDGEIIYYENSRGEVRDNRPKEQQLKTKI